MQIIPPKWKCSAFLIEKKIIDDDYHVKTTKANGWKGRINQKIKAGN